MTIKIEEYFANKGIKVRYNTLGNDETLVKAFVHNFQNDVDSSSGKSSQYVKDHLYSRLYPIKPRTKLTGFEKFKKIDIGFRRKLSPLMTSVQFSPVMLIDKTIESQSIGYKDALKNSLKTIENPLLYLSGGIDSELVCLALLDAGIEFQTVMFEWVDNTGFILNEEDLSFARELCKTHNLSPIVERVNIESLWQSLEFEQMSKDLGIASPQLVTHAYSIQLMSEKLPDVTHMFGGEVRFQSDYLLDNGERANLVYLVGKVIPPSWNGFTVQPQSDTFYSPATAQGYLVYNLSPSGFSAGSWWLQVYDYDSAGNTSTGTWTSTPSLSYEYRVTSSTGSPNRYPTAATGWASIPTGTNITLCSCYAYAGSTPSSDYQSATFTIEVRKVGTTTPVASGTITFNCIANNNG
jgi:hypothetical protein